MRKCVKKHRTASCSTAEGNSLRVNVRPFGDIRLQAAATLLPDAGPWGASCCTRGKTDVSALAMLRSDHNNKG